MTAVLIDRYCDVWSRLGFSQSLIMRRSLPLFEEACLLATAEIARNGRKFKLMPAAAVAWKKMKAAADRDGVEIYIVSAYRSVQHQAELISNKLEAGQPLEKVLQVIAPPGCSEHHTGKAVDVGTRGAQPLDPGFESTPAFAWLKAHAARFGFSLSFPPDNVYGYVYEPWHWCFAEAPSGDDGRS